MGADVKTGSMNSNNPEISTPELSVSESTYRRLLDMILSKELVNGQVLEERPLAKRLDVSRTPLRMALNRLFGEGMIGRLSNGVYIVQNGHAEDYLHLISVRRLLEGEAAAQAAGSISRADIDALRTAIVDFRNQTEPQTPTHWDIDDRLHTLIAEASGNPWLAKMILDVRRRVRMCNVEKIPTRRVETCDEHLAILDAVERGDGASARTAMQHHLDAVRHGFVQLLNIR